MNISFHRHACFSLRRALPLAAAAVMLAAFVLGAVLWPGAASADAPTSAAVTTLYSFGVPDINAPGWPIGSSPFGLAAVPGGGVVALTQAGGVNGVGTIAQFGSGGTNPSALYTFTSSPSADSSLLAGAGGTVYQTDPTGGANSSGALNSVAPGGSQETALYSFSAVDGSGNNAGGSYPVGTLLQGTGGTLYGETQQGGPNNAGVVYKINPDGTGFTVLHAFGSGTDGVYPSGGLILGPDGFLYGVTADGGSADSGTVFKVSTNGSVYTLLYQFSADPTLAANVDGADPTAALTLGSDGLLYGVTPYGGAGGSGVVFQLTADGSNFSVVYAFSATGSDPGNPNANLDGATPNAALVKDSEGSFYGTTVSGGEAGQGTVFLITAGGVLFNTLYTFTPGSGESPVLTMGSDGVLYGLTTGGGANGYGSLFQVSLHRPATHVLWDNASGAAAIWTYSALSGTFSEDDYGPYPGWTAQALADGPDSLTRVLWTNTNGSASIWSLNTLTGGFTDYTFGPYAGWTAKALSVGADNTTHVLWTNTNGTAALWNYSTADGTFTQNQYGPYSNWTASAVADGPDDMTRVLWTSTTGAASVWSLDNLAGTFTQLTYGPYPGWSAGALTVNVDNTTQVLWNNSNGTLACWNYSTDTGFLGQNDFGPYSGWTAKAVADGSDALGRILWTNTNGAASLWSLNTLTGGFTQNTYGPYAGWTAKSLSAGQ